MPVRDVDAFAQRRGRVLVNRGLNGIDGIVSSAAGAAAVGGTRAVALVGDLALLHDLGGLVTASRLGVDADGGLRQQRRRRHLPLPAHRRSPRALRGALRHAPPAGSGGRGADVRSRLRAGFRRRRAAGGAAAASEGTAADRGADRSGRRTWRSTARSWRRSSPGWEIRLERGGAARVCRQREGALALLSRSRCPRAARTRRGPGCHLVGSGARRPRHIAPRPCAALRVLDGRPPGARARAATPGAHRATGPRERHRGHRRRRRARPPQGRRRRAGGLHRARGDGEVRRALGAAPHPRLAEALRRAASSRAPGASPRGSRERAAPPGHRSATLVLGGAATACDFPCSSWPAPRTRSSPPSRAACASGCRAPR